MSYSSSFALLGRRMCFECNSLNNTNCFDLSIESNVFIGVPCESTDKVKKTCYSAHISGMLM